MPGDPDGNTINYIGILITILSFIISVLYASAEALCGNVNENKVKHDSENGDKKAKRLEKLLDKRNAVASPLQFGLVFFGIIFTAAAVFTFTLPVALWLSIDAVLSFIIMTAAAILVVFIFGDFMPKKLTIHGVDNYNYKTVGLITLLNAVMTPAYLLVSVLSDLILKIFGYDPNSIEETVTEDEIMFLVGEGEESGAIEETEKDMIENILDFNDITASEIMTHRIDICAVEDTESIEKLIEVGIEEGRSRIPVYHEDIDSVVGICYVKDLLPYVGKEIPHHLKLKDFLRPAYFIPESKKCSALFEEMTARKVQIAIIVDEYGGTSGLVTLEDLVESILGNIQDEYDNESEEIEVVSENEFTVDGTTSIDEVSDLVGTDIPEGDYDTIAGFVTEQLGRILKEDEHPTVETDHMVITVLEVEDQRISKLSIVKKESKDEDDDDEKHDED